MALGLYLKNKEEVQVPFMLVKELLGRGE